MLRPAQRGSASPAHTRYGSHTKDPRFLIDPLVGALRLGAIDEEEPVTDISMLVAMVGVMGLMFALAFWFDRI
jgi:hypothetical protein